MLNLKLATDKNWADIAALSIEEILTDHAFCEQKAASSCISMIQLFSDKDLMVEKLAPLVSEEWSHFRLVLRELKKRGFWCLNAEKPLEIFSYLKDGLAVRFAEEGKSIPNFEVKFVKKNEIFF